MNFCVKLFSSLLWYDVSSVWWNFRQIDEILLYFRVPLTFSTLWYQWGLLTIVVVMCEGSKTGFRIFLSITKTSPGHFEVRGFTVVKSKNWPPLIFLKLKFSYINQGPWTWIKRNYINISHRKKVYLVIDLKISTIWKSHFLLIHVQEPWFI